MTPSIEMAIGLLDDVCEEVHAKNRSVGWWDVMDHIDRVCSHDIGDEALAEELKGYVRATKIALIHSEASELLEGLRKNTMDDHLKHRATIEAEAADILIRLLDFCGEADIALGTVTLEKMEYNAQRADHKRENRAKDGGKQF